MKNTPRKCMHCRERSVIQTKLPLYERELEHDGRKYAVALKEFEVLQCQNCGALVLDDAADDRLSEALRRAAGLLTPTEIKQNREALGLKQRELANLLRIAESTLSRWETGAQIQQRCMDLLLRLFFGVKEARVLAGFQEPAWHADLRSLSLPGPFLVGSIHTTKRRFGAYRTSTSAQPHSPHDPTDTPGMAA
jgi:putative zinc finger/helix-turn-helix YgiT family protein